jgi:glycosyltransferase involved in cell wall biosynthesis
MKSKLLIIASHLSTGGAPQFTLNKIELLLDIYDVYCVEYDFFSPDFVVQRNKIIEILDDKFIPLYDDKNKLIDILNELKPDIISIEEISETFMSENLMKEIWRDNRTWKIIETTHSSHDKSNLKRYFPDKFTFVSPYSLEMYKHLGIESTIIEYPIDTKERNKLESQNKLGLDTTKKHILNVGLFTSGKNQGYAFEIARKLPDYEFHFVGNLAGNFQSYWGPILQNKPDNCIIWGERKDVSDFIEACDLFLFTSRFELNPLVIKEVLCYKDIPILMFNLHTYCGSYDTEKNCNFLTGDIDLDYQLVQTLTSKRGYVLYANEKYSQIVEKCAESIRKWSNLPIYIYCLNFELNTSINNTFTINWKFESSESNNMYQVEDDNFYINRCNSDIYDILIQRPLIVKHCLENFLELVSYVDSDSIATKYVDRIFNFFPYRLNYPYFVEGVYDYLFLNGRGGAWSKEDLSTTLEHPASELFGANQKIRERYRQTGYFVCGRNCYDFLNEWIDMCFNSEVLSDKVKYAPYHEETLANVLLWKWGKIDGLPTIYTNGSEETYNIIQKNGFIGTEQTFDNWIRIPGKKNNLLFFHGEKNIDKIDKMIKLIENL